MYLRTKILVLLCGLSATTTLGVLGTCYRISTIDKNSAKEIISSDKDPNSNDQVADVSIKKID